MSNLGFKPFDEWVAELRAHRDALRAELARIDTALAALEGAGSTSGTRAPVSAGAPTMLDLITRLFEESPANSYDAEEINKWLEEQGVSRDAARDPVNSVRGALSRLKQRGVIKNVRRGVFQLNRPDANTFDPQTTELLDAADRSIMSQGDPDEEAPA